MTVTAPAALDGSRPLRARAVLVEIAPAVAVMAWITLVLAVDHRVDATGQLALGVATWAVLIGLLSRQPRLVRVQVGVVVVFASLIEYTFAPVLGVYTYRLGGVAGVPSFVPPGHGLVYFAALVLGGSALFHQWRRLLIVMTLVLGGAYAMWGLLWSPQPDALGAFWYLCLVGFLVFGRQQLVYVGAFVVVTYLEVVGTHWGVWRWSTVDPTGLVSIGNPPSVAAGGYGWFDLAAITLAPWIVVKWDAIASRIKRSAVPATDSTQ